MKKGVIAGISVVAIGAAGAVAYMNPELVSNLMNNKPAETRQVETIQQHNERTAQLTREEMVIECTNQIEFVNSFKEMKSKMPEADQEKLNQAFNTIIQRKNLSQTDIDEKLCDLFKGWSEQKFLQEAAK